MKRQVYLDNLKLFLTLLVIFHHAALPHMPGSYWPYHFSDDSMLLPGIWHFLVMPPVLKFLFIGTLSTVVSFVVAGLITWVISLDFIHEINYDHDWIQQTRHFA